MKFYIPLGMGNLCVSAKDELNPIIDMQEMLMFAPITDFPLYEALYIEKNHQVRYRCRDN